MRATAGGLSAHYGGAISSSRPFSSVQRVSIESNDAVNTSNPAAIAFDLRMSNAAVDGVNFAVPAAADLCMNASVPAGATVLVGASRTPMTPPFSLADLGTCNYLVGAAARRTLRCSPRCGDPIQPPAGQQVRWRD